MSSRADKDKTKQLQDKCMSVLNALLRDEDNKYCVDCDSKGPRWASWNLGVFLCIRCAGIHRNLGVHISKVKSVNLDSWTPEQVVSLQQMGNSRARAVYEANLPDNFRRPQNDSSLETFIRAKYEHKKYIAREWVPPTLPEVNWEREIDEEIERQKRKKKTVLERKTMIGNNSSSVVEVPQLPKPKAASPKPGRPTVGQTSTQSTANNENNKSSVDLLGLQNGDDTFSNFLSAPPVPNTANGATNNAATNDKKQDVDNLKDAKSEEESFFNQTAPTEKEKVKMTKDSIMALYGAAPSTNSFPATATGIPGVNQSNHQAYKVGFPPGNAQQALFQQQQNFQAQGFPPQQQQQSGFSMGNGVIPHPQQYQQFVGHQQHQFQYPNQQFAMQQATPNLQQQQQQQQQQNQYQFQNQFSSQQTAGNNTQYALNQFQMAQHQQQQGNYTSAFASVQQQQLQQQQQQTQPFVYNQNVVAFPQQFGNLTLNDSSSTNSTAAQPSLAATATNLWQ